MTSTSLLVGMPASLRLSTTIRATIRRAIPIALPCFDRRIVMNLCISKARDIKEKIILMSTVVFVVSSSSNYLINLHPQIVNIDR